MTRLLPLTIVVLNPVLVRQLAPERKRFVWLAFEYLLHILKGFILLGNKLDVASCVWRHRGVIGGDKAFVGFSAYGWTGSIARPAQIASSPWRSIWLSILLSTRTHSIGKVAGIELVVVRGTRTVTIRVELLLEQQEIICLLIDLLWCFIVIFLIGDVVVVATILNLAFSGLLNRVWGGFSTALRLDFIRLPLTRDLLLLIADHHRLIFLFLASGSVNVILGAVWVGTNRLLRHFFQHYGPILLLVNYWHALVSGHRVILRVLGLLVFLLLIGLTLEVDHGFNCILLYYYGGGFGRRLHRIM